MLPVNVTFYDEIDLDRTVTGAYKCKHNMKHINCSLGEGT